jgi:hypothetical protein
VNDRICDQKQGPVGSPFACFEERLAEINFQAICLGREGKRFRSMLKRLNRIQECLIPTIRSLRRPFCDPIIDGIRVGISPNGNMNRSIHE